MGAAAVLLYFVLPSRFFILLETRDVLLLALVGVLGIEAVRLLGAVEVPTIREYERRRVASYAWYGVALVAAVLLFPETVAIAVVLGTAFVDPVIGELRRTPATFRRAYPWLPLALYAILAYPALVLGGWGSLRAAASALIAAVVAVAVERPKIGLVDDDLAMTLLPAVTLVAIGLLGAGAPLGGSWP